MYHFRNTRKHYVRRNRGDKVSKWDCPFPPCNDDDAREQNVLFENDTMYVISNRVSYDVFEMQNVEDHLMVIPKRHLESFAEFSDQERLDMMRIVSDHEGRGYHIFARGVGSVNRSVKHQHTHLIKLNNKKARLFLYSHKPYFLAKV